MAALLDIYLKEETLEMLLKGIRAKSQKGIGITVSIADETDKYGQNVGAYVSQTKEEREEKKKKYYVGNGKVFWTDNYISVASKIKRTESEPAPAEDSYQDDLPF